MLRQLVDYIIDDITHHELTNDGRISTRVTFLPAPPAIPRFDADFAAPMTTTLFGL